MRKPTIPEIQAYIVEKGWLSVSAQEFFDVNEAGEWEDKNGKPYKYWKKVLATWYHNSRKWGESKKVCRTCKEYADYTDTDDTGQQYWLCEAHKPRRKQIVPQELTEGLCKMPQHKTTNVNDERNRQAKALGWKY